MVLSWRALLGGSGGSTSSAGAALLVLRRSRCLGAAPRASSSASPPRPQQRQPRRAFTSLPVIDVSPLVNPQLGAAVKSRCAQELHAACRDVGFFVAANHGVPPAIYEGVLREARHWFALPEATKQSIALRGAATAYRGWQPLGANVTRLPGGGFVRDWHEAIDLFREDDPADIKSRGLPPSPLHGANPWPSQLPAFEAALRSYVGSCLTLGSALLRGIALGLGLREDDLGGGFAGPEASYWLLRVIHYPPLEQAGAEPGGGGGLREGAAAAAAGAHVGRDVQLSCGEHTDYGLLTLVNQETHVGGLQVQNAAGSWVDAAPIPGTFVCNIGETSAARMGWGGAGGDMFATLTNGLYAPTLHRVVHAGPPGSSRVSAPFFLEPAFDAVVAPLPQLVTAAGSAAGAPGAGAGGGADGGGGTAGGGDSARFPAVRYGSHLESKVLSNFEL
ncbi:MAG: hypothetical protein J3K34DRAFT_515859 [Monoraphidium minutum]|nr:MAG: hypothetical protein J3K34DRAFT_515859 [Monoraphidium minutum]